MSEICQICGSLMRASPTIGYLNQMFYCPTCGRIRIVDISKPNQERENEAPLLKKSPATETVAGG